MNYDIDIRFRPPPKKPIEPPVRVYVAGKQVGTLISYDHATGIGVASLPGSLTLPELVQLRVAEYYYEGLDGLDPISPSTSSKVIGAKYRNYAFEEGDIVTDYGRGKGKVILRKSALKDGQLDGFITIDWGGGVIQRSYWPAQHAYFIFDGRA